MSERNVQLKVGVGVATPAVPAGPSTYLGIGLAVVGAIGTIIAAVKTNDTATITAGVAALLAALATIGGRTAQAVALIRHGAVIAQPIVDAAMAGIQDPEADAVTDDELPTDEEEDASPPPDPSNVPVQPSQDAPASP